MEAQNIELEILRFVGKQLNPGTETELLVRR
jgi:hypothetical protein